jgi:hypothetical protein
LHEVARIPPQHHEETQVQDADNFPTDYCSPTKFHAQFPSPTHQHRIVAMGTPVSATTNGLLADGVVIERFAQIRNASRPSILISPSRYFWHGCAGSLAEQRHEMPGLHPSPPLSLPALVWRADVQRDMSLEIDRLVAENERLKQGGSQ